MAAKPKYRSDDIDLLLPSLRPVVRTIQAELVEEGFDPIPFDTARTLEEAARNAAKGTGIADSIHIYGCAVDFICGKHGWSCRAHRCKFFTRLAAAYRRHGLAAGADFRPKVDPPHGQGVAATRAAQDAVRKLGAGPESVEARDALVRAFLSRQR